MGTQTGVHRFSNEILQGMKPLIPSTYSVSWNKSKGSIRGYISLLKDFSKVLNKVNIIHFTVMTPAEIPFILFAKIWGKKVLTTYHGNYTKQRSIRNHPVLNSAFWLSDKFFRFLSNGLVSPSKYLHDELKLNSRKSHIIPNPYNLAQLQEIGRKSRFSGQNLRMITASNFNIKEKVDSLYYLCTAFSITSKQFSHMELLVFGDGIYLEDLRKKFEHSENIKFMGFRDDFTNYLRVSNVYAHFSTFDNQPYAVVDGLINGNVILCNDLPALTEMVEEQYNYIVKLDQTQIQKAIEKIFKELINNPESFSTKGRMNRKNALEKYSSDLVCSKYRELYDQMLL